MITAEHVAPAAIPIGHAHPCGWCGHWFVCDVLGYSFGPLCQTRCEGCRYQENFA